MLAQRSPNEGYLESFVCPFVRAGCTPPVLLNTSSACCVCLTYCLDLFIFFASFSSFPLKMAVASRITRLRARQNAPFLHSQHSKRRAREKKKKKRIGSSGSREIACLM